MAKNSMKFDGRGGHKTGPAAEFVKTIVFAGLIAALIHTFWFEPFYIPSGSMVPALQVGDYLVVNKFAYGYSRFSFPFAPDMFSGRIFGRAPKRGDVVVFRPPGDIGENYIKRVIGLPGDKIQVTNGVLSINGQQAARVDAGEYTDMSIPGAPVQARAYTETLPGGPADLILKRTDDGFANNTPVYTVPAGDLFMMGDNRDDSEDSRFPDGPVGFVPEENVIGPAKFIFFSIDLEQPLWQVWAWPFEIRWGRMFQSIS